MTPPGPANLPGATGNVSAPNGTGNVDLFISSDNTHPTAAGHEYSAWRLAWHLSVPA